MSFPVRLSSAVSLLMLSAALTACGSGGSSSGGSGSPPPSPPPPNEPPPNQPPQGSWSEPLAISASGAGDVQVAIDGAGNAHAVWRQLNEQVYGHSLWTSRYEAGNWSSPQLLESDAADIDKFTLAIEETTGRFTVVWSQLTTVGAYDLWARTFEPAGGWAPTTQIEAGPGSVSQASAGIDANGNTVVTWSQLNQRFHIWANRHVPGSGWGTPTLVEALNQLGTQDTEPKVAVAPAGDALVVWQRSDGTQRELWTNHFSTGTGWGSEQLLIADTGPNFSLAGQQIAIDGNGSATLVWGQWQLVNSTQESSVVSKRYAGGWQSTNQMVAPAVVSDLISHPRLSVNDQGYAAAIWVRKDLSVQATTAASGGAWDSLATLKPADTLEVDSLPVIGIDGDADVVVVWGQRSSDGNYDVVTSRYATATGWSTVTALDDTNDPAQSPALAVNQRGDAVVAWTQLFGAQGSRIVVRYYRNP